MGVRRVLFIVGPTAIGKTGVSLELAKLFDAEVISADSRQVYKFMDIGTAKPSRGELAAVPHHFIDHKYPNESYSAGQFGTEARQRIDEIIARGRQPMVVGGSGLYIRALVDGLFEPKIADHDVKMRLKQEAEERGLSAMYERLQQIDPPSATRLHATDTQRILRALEVYEITGEPFSKFRQKPPQTADFQPCFFGITTDRQQLYNTIEMRVDAMFQRGLVDEVMSLRKRGYGPELNAMQSVGYKEVSQYLNKVLTYEEMVKMTKQKSRNYAKRQLTWFGKDSRIEWLESQAFDSNHDLAQEIHKRFCHAADTLFETV